MSLLRAINITSYITLALATIMIIYTGCLLWWPVKIYEEHQLLTDKTEYYPGDPFYITDDRCKYKPYPAKVNVALVDDIVYQYSAMERNAPVGCGKIQGELRFIPTYATPGKYHVELTLAFRVNVLRTETFVVKSNDFQVIPSPDYE